MLYRFYVSARKCEIAYVASSVFLLDCIALTFSKDLPGSKIIFFHETLPGLDFWWLI